MGWLRCMYSAHLGLLQLVGAIADAVDGAISKKRGILALPILI